MPAISGQKTITAAGTAERLHAGLVVNCAVMVKALPANTGVAYVGNDGAGDVSSSNGLPLSASESVVFALVGDLREIWLDATVNAEGVAWLLLDA
jgi:hypothetical protein